MSRTKASPRTRGAKSWTVKRASGLGVMAGLAAIILAILHNAYPDALWIPYLAAAAVTAFCGLSILWITANDKVARGSRGGRVVPLRVFDLALGLLLSVPALIAIRNMLPEHWGL